MNQQQTADADALIKMLGELRKDVVERDMPRLKSLLRDGSLSNPNVLAAEMVETVGAITRDLLVTVTQLITEHQQGIVELEDATYHDTPRAIGILLSALEKKEIIGGDDLQQIRELVGSAGADQYSALTHDDAELILSVLVSFKALATDMAAKSEGAEESKISLAMIEKAIARVNEIALPVDTTEEEPEDDD